MMKKKVEPFISMTRKMAEGKFSKYAPFLITILLDLSIDKEFLGLI